VATMRWRRAKSAGFRNRRGWAEGGASSAPHNAPTNKARESKRPVAQRSRLSFRPPRAAFCPPWWEAVPLENPEIDTIHDIFPSAEACEREEWEKFGIKFIGHPRLKPLLLDDTLQGKWVQRKAYIPEPHRK